MTGRGTLLGTNPLARMGLSGRRPGDRTHEGHITRPHRFAEHRIACARIGLRRQWLHFYERVLERFQMGQRRPLNRGDMVYKIPRFWAPDVHVKLGAWLMPMLLLHLAVQQPLGARVQTGEQLLMPRDLRIQSPQANPVSVGSSNLLTPSMAGMDLPIFSAVAQKYPPLMDTGVRKPSSRSSAHGYQPPPAASEKVVRETKWIRGLQTRFPAMIPFIYQQCWQISTRGATSHGIGEVKPADLSRMYPLEFRNLLTKGPSCRQTDICGPKPAGFRDLVKKSFECRPGQEGPGLGGPGLEGPGLIRLQHTRDHLNRPTHQRVGQYIHKLSNHWIPDFNGQPNPLKSPCHGDYPENSSPFPAGIFAHLSEFRLGQPNKARARKPHTESGEDRFDRNGRPARGNNLTRNPYPLITSRLIAHVRHPFRNSPESAKVRLGTIGFGVDRPRRSAQSFSWIYINRNPFPPITKRLIAHVGHPSRVPPFSINPFTPLAQIPSNSEEYPPYSNHFSSFFKFSNHSSYILRSYRLWDPDATQRQVQGFQQKNVFSEACWDNGSHSLNAFAEKRRVFEKSYLHDMSREDRSWWAVLGYGQPRVLRNDIPLSIARKNQVQWQNSATRSAKPSRNKSHKALIFRHLTQQKRDNSPKKNGWIPLHNPRGPYGLNPPTITPRGSFRDLMLNPWIDPDQTRLQVEKFQRGKSFSYIWRLEKPYLPNNASTNPSTWQPTPPEAALGTKILQFPMADDSRFSHLAFTGFWQQQIINPYNFRHLPEPGTDNGQVHKLPRPLWENAFRMGQPQVPRRGPWLPTAPVDQVRRHIPFHWNIGTLRNRYQCISQTDLKISQFAISPWSPGPKTHMPWIQTRHEPVNRNRVLKALNDRSFSNYRQYKALKSNIVNYLPEPGRDELGRDGLGREGLPFNMSRKALPDAEQSQLFGLIFTHPESDFQLEPFHSQRGPAKTTSQVEKAQLGNPRSGDRVMGMAPFRNNFPGYWRAWKPAPQGVEPDPAWQRQTVKPTTFRTLPEPGRDKGSILGGAEVLKGLERYGGKSPFNPMTQYGSESLRVDGGPTPFRNDLFSQLRHRHSFKTNNFKHLPEPGTDSNTDSTGKGRVHKLPKPFSGPLWEKAFRFEQAQVSRTGLSLPAATLGQVRRHIQFHWNIRTLRNWDKPAAQTNPKISQFAITPWSLGPMTRTPWIPTGIEAVNRNRAFKTLNHPSFSNYSQYKALKSNTVNYLPEPGRDGLGRGGLPFKIRRKALHYSERSQLLGPVFAHRESDFQSEPFHPLRGPAVTTAQVEKAQLGNPRLDDWVVGMAHCRVNFPGYWRAWKPAPQGVESDPTWQRQTMKPNTFRTLPEPGRDNGSILGGVEVLKGLDRYQRKSSFNPTIQYGPRGLQKDGVPTAVRKDFLSRFRHTHSSKANTLSSLPEPGTDSTKANTLSSLPEPGTDSSKDSGRAHKTPKPFPERFWGKAFRFEQAQVSRTGLSQPASPVGQVRRHIHFHLNLNALRNRNQRAAQTNLKVSQFAISPWSPGPMTRTPWIQTGIEAVNRNRVLKALNARSFSSYSQSEAFKSNTVNYLPEPGRGGLLPEPGRGGLGRGGLPFKIRRKTLHDAERSQLLGPVFAHRESDFQSEPFHLLRGPAKTTAQVDKAQAENPRPDDWVMGMAHSRNNFPGYWRAWKPAPQRVEPEPARLLFQVFDRPRRSRHPLVHEFSGFRQRETIKPPTFRGLPEPGTAPGTASPLETFHRLAPPRTIWRVGGSQVGDAFPEAAGVIQGSAFLKSRPKHRRTWKPVPHGLLSGRQAGVRGGNANIRAAFASWRAENHAYRLASKRPESHSIREVATAHANYYSWPKVVQKTVGDGFLSPAAKDQRSTKLTSPPLEDSQPIKPSPVFPSLESGPEREALVNLIQREIDRRQSETSSLAQFDQNHMNQLCDNLYHQLERRLIRERERMGI